MTELFWHGLANKWPQIYLRERRDGEKRRILLYSVRLAGGSSLALARAASPGISRCVTCYGRTATAEACTDTGRAPAARSAIELNSWLLLVKRLILSTRSHKQ